ncbi:capsule biosynthesis protein [Ovoidimarina sediminis]|uniref:capsule biosynthesis protein n=1 Tax=Ovoidimarina sediminis TaxID=3079856 RepID=UPI00292FA8D2|nr:capsule biosynthesis protein [Rhodophyticola sp. MJ-SS7]
MARRLAHKHGLAPVSEFDAVRLLRKKGIDPFQRANMLELVVADTTPPKEEAPTPKIIRPEMKRSTALSTDVADPLARGMQEVAEIQRDIVRRRRRSLALLAARLGAFVALPTLFVGIYFFAVATPMYATKSEFVIQQADSAAGAGMGGLLSGTGLGTSQDSITVQGYLNSREAMLRLDADKGFKAHFSDPSVDFIQRLDPDASNEDAYKIFRRNVKIGYDPTEGLVRMEVIAASPEVSADFSRALIGYAEEQVDHLTQRLRADQMKGANSVFEEAEAKMVAAQERVLALQEQLGVFDPVSENSALMSQITNFEVQLAEKRLSLQQLLDNAQPNQARVAGTEGDIARLETMIADLRSQLTQGRGAEGSLASVSGQLRMAEVDLETRTLMMQEALQQLESARVEANRQVRYLSLGVNPVPPDEPTYPRAFENTILALLIFSGIYLLISLTASILREQVSN